MTATAEDCPHLWCVVTSNASTAQLICTECNAALQLPVSSMESEKAVLVELQKLEVRDEAKRRHQVGNEPVPLFEFVSAADDLAQADEEDKWLVEKLLPVG